LPPTKEKPNIDELFGTIKDDTFIEPDIDELFGILSGGRLSAKKFIAQKAIEIELEN
jgi:hypothetical protein